MEAEKEEEGKTEDDEAFNTGLIMNDDFEKEEEIQTPARYRIKDPEEEVEKEKDEEERWG